MSFKIVRGSSETKYLSTSSFPQTGVSTTTDYTWFGWMYVATGSKWNRLLSNFSDDTGSPIDYAWMGRESIGVMRGAIVPYSQAGAGFASGSIATGAWKAYLMRSQLGTSGKMQATGVTEETSSPLGSPWNGSSSTYLRNLRIGATYNGTDDDGQTIYFAHVCVWKARLSDANCTSLIGGANPLAIDASNILEYWTGASLTGYNGTVLSEVGSGTFTANDAENPTVDDPPGGDASEALSGSALTPGAGTHAPGHSIALRERLRQRFVSLPGRSILVPGWFAARTKFA